MISQSQVQTLKLLPQQIHLLNLFQLNSQELQMRLQQEMAENPYLEEITPNEQQEKENFNHEAEQDYKDWEEYAYNDLPNYKTEMANYFSGDNIPEYPIVENSDFRSDAKQQLSMHTSDERMLSICNYIVDSLEPTGFLEKDVESLADDFSFSNFIINAGEVSAALIIIQELEPPGLGLKGIREWWLFQLARRDNESRIINKSIELLEFFYDDFKGKHFEKIIDMLFVSQDEFREIMALLGKLSMRPVSGYQTSETSKSNIIPDVLISVSDDNVFTITISGILAENFRISESLNENMRITTEKSTLKFLRSKMQSANWVLYALRQRNESIMKIVKAIVKLQKNYFETGDINKLKPMILKNIADLVGLDISTVSRLTNNKYADTHFGIIHLKDLFTEGIINNIGSVISNRVIRSALEEVIEKENKKNPYTDQQLVKILMSQGIKVARRTIAKYRDQLQIPVAQLRLMWA